MAEFKDLFNQFTQVGIVVKDLEKAKAAMKHIFGLDPRDAGVTHHKNTLYFGKPSKCGVHTIFYDFCNIEIEIMSPVGDEKSIWKDFVNEHGSGIHHICFDIPDHETVKQGMAERGIEAYHCGDSARGSGVKFSYYDLGPALGFVIETLNFREFKKDE